MSDPRQPAERPTQPDGSTPRSSSAGNGGWRGEESGDSPFGWFVGAAIGLLVAVLCFTPIWDEVAGRGSGRRAGFTALLAGIGPIGVAAIAVGVAVVFVFLGFRARRAGRDAGHH